MSSLESSPTAQADRPVAPDDDPERDRIVAEEQRCLERVLAQLDARERRASDPPPNAYDRELIELRDMIATARLEDVPPLLEQMERVQSLALRRRTAVGEAWVDPRCPYFGRLVLQEGARRREVLIGRGTYLDTDAGIRIVDWRDAPVSRLYYRYDERDDYDEVFGERRVEGEVLIRRTVTIVDRELRRVVSPQGSFVKRRDGRWQRLGSEGTHLSGGQGTALRAEEHHRTGKLGILGDEDVSEDKHLREITALIDARQFDLITRPDSGLVVIQGGAGSGKTTIGLHRLAYLAFQDKRRFRPDRMLVIVYNDALARYISLVLPALDVTGVSIRTFEDWAARLRRSHFPDLPRGYRDDTPVAVTRLKKHPAMLVAIDAHVARQAAAFERTLEQALAGAAPNLAREGRAAWRRSSGGPLVHRLYAMESWLRGTGQGLDVNHRVALDGALSAAQRQARDVIGHWAELLSDREALSHALDEYGRDALSAGEVARAHAWCAQRCAEVLTELEAREESAGAGESSEEIEREPGVDVTSLPEEPEDAEASGEEQTPSQGVDGRELEERVELDREDDAVLLRLYQRLRGPLMRGTRGKEALVYEHVLVDEAQDLSPVELGVVLGSVSKSESVTLAGDTAQRLHMDNGFSDWQTVLGDLGLRHIEVEPLRLSYRSTREIVQFGRAVLGPLAPPDEPLATRGGVPVGVFSFAHGGDSVAFLGEALRELAHVEPRASVAVVARYPEHADTYYEGLRQAEVPFLRRIARQDFPFRAGIDVTDVRQVKGLEFDYVVLVEVSESSYPAEDEARHLLHIGATRAAHQLWVLATGRPSPLVPNEMLDNAL